MSCQLLAVFCWPSAKLGEVPAAPPVCRTSALITFIGRSPGWEYLSRFSRNSSTHEGLQKITRRSPTLIRANQRPSKMRRSQTKQFTAPRLSALASPGDSACVRTLRECAGPDSSSLHHLAKLPRLLPGAIRSRNLSCDRFH